MAVDYTQLQLKLQTAGNMKTNRLIALLTLNNPLTKAAHTKNEQDAWMTKWAAAGVEEEDADAYYNGS